MSENERRLLDALAKISEVASDAANGGEDSSYHEKDDDTSDQATQEGKGVCTPKALPTRLAVKAAETAVRINPVNAPAHVLSARLRISRSWNPRASRFSRRSTGARRPDA